MNALLNSAPDFEWMSSRSSSKKRRSPIANDDSDDPLDYEEEIKFTGRRPDAKVPTERIGTSSSPLMNFKLLDLTSFDDDIEVTGSCSTDGALVDPAEVPLYEEGPFEKGQNAWVQFGQEDDWDDIDGITYGTYWTESTKWGSYYNEDAREDPECEYFDLTAMSSDDITMATTTSTTLTGMQSVNASQGRDPSNERGGGRFTYEDKLDEQGKHPSEYYDLTVLSEEDEGDFDHLFNVVSHVKNTTLQVPAPFAGRQQPLEPDIVDLTADSSPDKQIWDLTALTGDGPEEETLTESGSVIVDLTHVLPEDEFREDPSQKDRDPEPAEEYNDPFPSLPMDCTSYESCNSRGSRSSTASTYQSGSFDWMTKPGVTVVAQLAASDAIPPPHVHWSDGVGHPKKINLELLEEPIFSSKSILSRDPEGIKKTDEEIAQAAAIRDREEEEEEEEMAGILDEQDNDDGILDLREVLSQDDGGDDHQERDEVFDLPCSSTMTPSNDTIVWPSLPHEHSQRGDAKTRADKVLMLLKPPLTTKMPTTNVNASVAESTAEAARGFLHMLWDPTATACQTTAELPPMKETSRASELRDSRVKKKRSTEHVHDDLEGIPDHHSAHISYRFTTEGEAHAENRPTVEPDKETIIQRERIENLRIVQQLRQQELSSFLEGVPRGVLEPPELGGMEKAEDEHMHDGIEVAAMENLKPKIKKSKQKEKRKKDAGSLNEKSKGENSSYAGVTVASTAVTSLGTQSTSKSKKKSKDKEKDNHKDKKKNEKDKSKTKDKKKSKSKNKKKDKKREKAKAKNDTGVVMTWMRVKASLAQWKKRDVALFTPSSSEDDDTDHDNKKRREEVRRLIERAAFENVRISKSSTMKSDKLSLAQSPSTKPDSVSKAMRPSTNKISKKSKKALKPSRKAEWKPEGSDASAGPVYDGDADTNSEHESRRKGYESLIASHVEDKDEQPKSQLTLEATGDNSTIESKTSTFLERTIEGGKLEMMRLRDIDMEVQQQTAAAAQVAIAIAAASRSARVSFIEGGSAQVAEPIPEKTKSDSELETKEVIEEAQTNFYLRDKEPKSICSHPSNDQSGFSTSFYSTAAEETDDFDDNEGTNDEKSYSSYEEPQETTSFHSAESNPSTASSSSASSKKSHQTREPSSTMNIVPHMPVILVNDYGANDSHGAVKRLDDGAQREFPWLYGQDVKLPFFLHACIQCPSVPCCDVWLSSQASPDLEQPPKKIKSSSDSHTYTTRGSTLNLPVPCWAPSVECIDDSTMQFGCRPVKGIEVPKSFCDMPASFYNDHSYVSTQSCGSPNPAETDTERSASPTPSINSSVKWAYHVCGIDIHNQTQGVEDQSPIIPGSCGLSSASTDDKMEGNDMLVPDHCGAMKHSTRQLNLYAADAVLGQCVRPPLSRARNRKAKKSVDSVSSKSLASRRGRRSKRRNKNRDDDAINDPVSYSFTINNSLSKHERQSKDLPGPDSDQIAEYNGIMQAKEDAFALLSQQSQLPTLKEVTHNTKVANETSSHAEVGKVFDSQVLQVTKQDKDAEKHIRYSGSGYWSASSDNRSTGKSQTSSQQGQQSKSPTEDRGHPSGLGAPRHYNENARNREVSTKDAISATQSMGGSTASSSRKSVKSKKTLAEASQAKRSMEASLTSSRKSLMEVSRSSSLFTPDEMSIDDISLGYSESNLEAWSFEDGVGQEKRASGLSPLRHNEKQTTTSCSKKDKIKKKTEIEKVKNVKASHAHSTAASQPISTFVMSIFGASASTEEKTAERAPPEMKEKHQATVSAAMERPRSLRSLASYSSTDSENIDLGSDRSLSSLSHSLTGRKSKQSSTLDRKRLEVLVSDLMAHPNGFIFSTPVDTTEFPDYKKIVKKPMDLGIVLKKLLSGGYPSLLDFHGDVSLTFDNAMLYNPEGSKVYDMAAELKEVFEVSFLDILDALEAELIEKEEEEELMVI